MRDAERAIDHIKGAIGLHRPGHLPGTQERSIGEVATALTAAPGLNGWQRVTGRSSSQGEVMAMQNYAARDETIRINSYTTVLRRERVPHEVFATYWRDVHGPLCSRIPGLGWYVQTHLSREQDAHLWADIDGITPLPGYVLDGGVEIGFANAADQAVFKTASHILFSDEQNMFAETLAYNLPQGSWSFVDRWPDPAPNGNDSLDRIHMHFSPLHDDVAGFQAFLADGLATTLAASPDVWKLRLHLPEPYDNAAANPPSPDVAHHASPERTNLAMMEIAFANPLARRAFYASDLFQSTVADQRRHIRHATAFAVSGVYTYVRDKTLTTAGLRGSRAAQLIERLGANNQVSPEVTHLVQFATLP